MRILWGPSRNTAEAVGLLRAVIQSHLAAASLQQRNPGLTEAQRRPEEMITMCPEEMITMSGAEWFSRCGAPADYTRYK